MNGMSDWLSLNICTVLVSTVTVRPCTVCWPLMKMNQP